MKHKEYGLIDEVIVRNRKIIIIGIECQSEVRLCLNMKIKSN